MKIKTIYKIITIASLWVILLGFILNLKQQHYFFPDEISYYIAAKQLYIDFILNDHRPLLISAIFGLPLLFGVNVKLIFLWGILVNVVSWFFTIVLIYKIGILFLSKKGAFYCALIYIFLIGNLFITFHLLSEIIFIFFMISAIYLIGKFQHSNEINILIYAHAIIVLSVLIKPIAVVILFGFILIYLKTIFISFKLIRKTSFFVIIFSFSLVFFQLVYMKKLYGIYTISNVDSATYYNYLGTRANCLEKNIEFKQGENQRVIDFKKLNHLHQKNIANQDFRHQLFNNTINFGKAFFINLYINSTKGSAAVYSLSNNDASSFYKSLVFFLKAISKIQNIVLSIIGIFLSIITIKRFKRKSKYEIFLSYTIISVILFSAISSDQGDRLHLIIFPLVLILIALYIKHLFAPLQK